jgi:hypothetical protein
MRDRLLRAAADTSQGKRPSDRRAGVPLDLPVERVLVERQREPWLSDSDDWDAAVGGRIERSTPDAPVESVLYAVEVVGEEIACCSNQLTGAPLRAVGVDARGALGYDGAARELALDALSTSYFEDRTLGCVLVAKASLVQALPYQLHIRLDLHNRELKTAPVVGLCASNSKAAHVRERCAMRPRKYGVRHGLAA